MPNDALVTAFLGYIFQMRALDYTGREAPAAEEDRFVSERLRGASAGALSTVGGLKEWARARARTAVPTDDLISFHDKFVDALVPVGLPPRAHGAVAPTDKEYAPYISRWVMTLIDTRPNMAAQMGRCHPPHHQHQQQGAPRPS
jgi:hypothetical protein